MKLTKTKDKLKVTKEFPGLLSCEFEHNIKSSSAELNYTGPMIPPEVWHKVLSFFRWTYETTKSESQARFYVNPRTGTWDAWAYPQEARTGMTAKELEGPATNEQRAQFGEPWIYFGTVHHHCNCSAFQSGTDQSNEENQDGLHITVGNIDAKRHDLHCRFYLGGCGFDPDMGFFWNVGEEVAALIPVDLWDRVARHQMGERIDVEFPAQWKENLIEIKPVPYQFQPSWTPSGHFATEGKGKKGKHGNKHMGVFPYSLTYQQRVELAVEQVLRETVDRGVKTEEIIEAVRWMGTEFLADVILTACEDYKIDTTDIWQKFPNNEAEVASWLIDDHEPAKQIGDGKGPVNEGLLGEHWGGMMD